MVSRAANELQAILDRAAGPGVPLTAKKMFGGVGCYADGHIFAIIWAGGIALKLLEADFDAFCAAGGRPVKFMPDKPPSKSYVRTPDRMLDWTGRAVRAALAAPATAKKVRRRRRLRAR
jgi:TfoX/Sxy family transcriptional regulator of competence genes